MKLPRYPLASNSKLSTFEFISEGDKGLITKLIQFQKTNLADVYNLAFGDKDPDSGAIDDKVVSNNGEWEEFKAGIDYDGFLAKRKGKTLTKQLRLR